MKTLHWILLAAIIGFAGFFGGYRAASATGIEPQHFEAVESGGYGASDSDLESIGLDKAMTDYYKDLQK